MYGWHTQMGWLGLLYFAVMMILFWGGLIASVIVIARAMRVRRQDNNSPLPSSAEQILAERFARGDLDEETYRRQREVIRPH